MCTEFSSLITPISVVVLPAAAVVISGLTGETFSSAHVAETFKTSYLDALEASADALNGLPDMIQSIGDAVSDAFSSALDALSSAVQEAEISVSSIFNF